MLQGSLTAALVVFSIIALVIIVLLWWRRDWFVQWLKGTAGFVLLALIIYMLLTLSDLWSYQQFDRQESVATVSVYELDAQEYDLTLIGTDGKEQRFKILGDQWQLDVRMLLWKGPFADDSLPLYRLDRLSGRYYSLEQERNAERSVYSLAQSRWFDVWEWSRKHAFWLDAQVGSAVFVPLVNGAVYNVGLTSKGLVVKPLNDVAEQAVQQAW